VNVDNAKLTDAEFRQFVRNTLPIVIYDECINHSDDENVLELNDIKTFVNPVNGPHFEGAFTVEITEGAPTSHVPSSATITGNCIYVPGGTVQQVAGGIHMYSGKTLFVWGYKYIKRIRKGDGSLLWVNNQYR
jgi:hypothetical protein